ncbi:hypothetical protein OGAPHI_007058 [Ogataea philodendri]|uniref:HMG box domain-containing protein n=1 Tax=Ogataea philodendri TaxID=1378263 RepID=A0A9P8NW03_9ASCO|nr:uncharacterized protein OGAPHI_007058 [Ogataea philodendri]KAH3660472.1 hypothetical protein OGAPHI_007058 [Ogataea philodendri]
MFSLSIQRAPLLVFSRRFISTSFSVWNQNSDSIPEDQPSLSLKKVRDASKPKPPRSAYQSYISHRFATNQITGKKAPELMATFAKDWASGSDEIKQSFIEAHKKLKDQYTEELEAWKEKHLVRSPYINFIRSEYPKRITTDFQSNSAIIKELAEDWNSLTPEEKESYRSK